MCVLLCVLCVQVWLLFTLTLTIERNFTRDWDCHIYCLGLENKEDKGRLAGAINTAKTRSFIQGQ